MPKFFIPEVVIRQLNYDLLKQIMEYSNIDTPNIGQYFNTKIKKLCIRFPINIVIPRQAAGFGISEKFYYRLTPGIYDKDKLSRTLLCKGYFGEIRADLVVQKWINSRTVVVLLDRNK